MYESFVLWTKRAALKAALLFVFICCLLNFIVLKFDYKFNNFYLYPSSKAFQNTLFFCVFFFYKLFQCLLVFLIELCHFFSVLHLHFEQIAVQKTIIFIYSYCKFF